MVLCLARGDQLAMIVIDCHRLDLDREIRLFHLCRILDKFHVLLLFQVTGKKKKMIKKVFKNSLGFTGTRSINKQGLEQATLFS